MDATKGGTGDGMARRTTVRTVAAFISDRGDRYLPACLDSFEENVRDILDAKIVDDHEHNLGMAGAVRAAWQWALDKQADYLFHVEEDFTFNEPVCLERLRWILELHPELAQIVLKRQRWSAETVGFMEDNPSHYVQRAHWVEHFQCFSLNPCLIPRKILELGWPDGNEAEFTQLCLDKGFHFGIYGNIEDPPRVHHHGDVRSAGWRL